MLLFANSLDGVRGGLVSGIQPAMGGLEGISRVGRTLVFPARIQFRRRTMGTAAFGLSRKAHVLARMQISPRATLEHVGTAAVGCPAERSSARCSDTSVRHLQKNFGGGRASPPVKVRALACFPN